jgi:antitoxin component YwqK of YwqJK toxin-antitoxin module
MNGMKVGDGHYNKGKGYQRAYYPNGRARLYVPYNNNRRNGYEIQYDQTGKEVIRTFYKDDAIVE